MEKKITVIGQHQLYRNQRLFVKQLKLVLTRTWWDKLVSVCLELSRPFVEIVLPPADVPFSACQFASAARWRASNAHHWLFQVRVERACPLREKNHQIQPSGTTWSLVSPFICWACRQLFSPHSAAGTFLRVQRRPSKSRRFHSSLVCFYFWGRGESPMWRSQDQIVLCPISRNLTSDLHLGRAFLSSRCTAHRFRKCLQAQKLICHHSNEC